MTAPFPQIPEVEDDRVLGKTDLNAYKRAILWLLQDSHAPYAMQHAAPTKSTTETDYDVQMSYYTYCLKDQLRYRFQATCAGGTHYWKLEYEGDDASWHTAGSAISGTAQTYTQFDGTFDLSGEAELTAGNLYKWRWSNKSSAGDSVSHRLWYLSEFGEIGAWTTPTDFANGGTSTASDFNDLRTGLNDLHDTLAWPVMVPSPMRASNQFSDSFSTIDRFCYRYRPGGLYVLMRGKTAFGTWQWKLVMEDTAGNEADIYTSGNVAADNNQWTYETAEIDLTTGDPATALSNAGITLTNGEMYKISLQAKESTQDSDSDIEGCGIFRQSDLSVTGNWETMKTWALGDDDVGETELDYLSNNTTQLYSGDEALWGESQFVVNGDGDNWDTYGYLHMHRFRWLHYFPEDTSTVPEIHYDIDTTNDEHETYRLETGSTWAAFNLGQLPIAPGSRYIVWGAKATMESEEVLI